ncbi:MAG: peptidase MA family metallohydrolase [Elusimicrobiota bacterium]
MDVLLRLRVLIWVLVISLWGVMVYQYLGEEEKDSTAMRPVVNPYTAPAALPPVPLPDAGAAPPETNAPTSFIAPAPNPAAVLNPAVPRAALPPAMSADPSENVRPAPDTVGPAAPGDRRDGAPPVAAPARASRVPRAPVARGTRQQWREERNTPLPDPPVPPGFQKSVTRHFNVYAEQYAASDRFLELLENLHGNLMLDLAPFSPWASDQKVSVFLFKNQDTYRRVTGRPPWSGGASSVPKRKVYVYESEELPGILAHELTHIYFDSFFLGATNDPLWLSEGMATLVQVERGLAAPNWLKENLAQLESGSGLPLETFMEVKTTAGWSDEKVRLWYAQSYSIVRYLIRTQYRSSYYKFASYLRDGRPVPESLYRAYGAPYTRVRALEIAWRHEISHGATDRLPSGE